MPRDRPTLFIGSSSEGLKIARAIQVLLDHSCEVTIWSQGVFGLSEGSLESLVSALDDFDFAVLVLTPDDLLTSRNEASSAPRDNVLFELGLFMGALGRKRTYIVHDRSTKLKLPSDLAGVSAATFEPHSTGNLQSALGAATTQIEDQITKYGIRDAERLKGLSEAAKGFDYAALEMEKLLKLIARSRKVELDIISSQFGPFIAPEKLKQINQDLVDLEEALNRPTKLTQ
jgi:Predicted nucleotide-binding protein containing TIR-like domain